MSPTRTLVSLAALGCCAAIPASAFAAGGLSSGVHDLGSGGDAPKLAGATLDLEYLEVRTLVGEGWREVPVGTSRLRRQRGAPLPPQPRGHARRLLRDPGTLSQASGTITGGSWRLAPGTGAR